MTNIGRCRTLFLFYMAGQEGSSAGIICPWTLLTLLTAENPKDCGVFDIAVGKGWWVGCPKKKKKKNLEIRCLRQLFLNNINKKSGGNLGPDS